MDIEKLKELSDWQLNQLMHNLVKCRGEYKVNFHNEDEVSWSCKETGGEYLFSKNKAVKNVDDYSDWNVLMPIVERLQIKLDPRKSIPKLWWIASYNDRLYVVDTSVNKALLLCCILVLESGVK